MRLKILISSTLATLVIVPALIISAHTHAAVLSSIEGGDIYRVKNITKGTDFSDPNNADACDVLQYKVRLHNGGPTDVLNNVTVQAAFPTGASTKNVSLMTARASNASPSSTSDNATVNLTTSQSLSYVSGSTQLLDSNDNLIKVLPDGITGAGVNIGQSLGISINEMRFVQFEEKVSCPTPPVTTPPTITTPRTTETVTSATAEAPPELVNTGPGSMIALFAGTSIVGTLVFHYALSRRLSRD